MSGFALAAAPFKRSCWDTSYARNRFQVTENTKGFEVSFQGASLGQLRFHAINGEQFDFNGWSSGDSIHAWFSKEQCSVGGKSIVCFAAIEGNKNDDPLLFVQRSVADFDKDREVISPIYSSSLLLKVDTLKTASLTIENKESKSEFQVAKVTFDDRPYSCDSESSAIVFPLSLRNFLAVRN